MSTYEGNRYAFPATAITAGTFDNARLSSGSVTQHVDLTALSASNLTSGTIPNARYGTPTFSGANITNLSTTTVTGNWTPSFSAGSFTDITGKYQKVGQFVFCQAEARCTSNPNVSGSSNYNQYWYMGGLPFTAISYAQGHSSWLVGTGQFHSSMQLNSQYDIFVNDNSTTFSLHIDVGWRNTQYYSTHSGYGGVRNYDLREVERSTADESWVYIKVFYVANS